MFTMELTEAVKSHIEKIKLDVELLNTTVLDLQGDNERLQIENQQMNDEKQEFKTQQLFGGSFFEATQKKHEDEISKFENQIKLMAEEIEKLQNEKSESLFNGKTAEEHNREREKSQDKSAYLNEMNAALVNENEEIMAENRDYEKSNSTLKDHNTTLSNSNRTLNRQNKSLVEALNQKVFELKEQHLITQNLQEIIQEISMQADNLRYKVIGEPQTANEVLAPKQSMKEKIELKEKAQLLKQEMLLKYNKEVAEDGSISYTKNKNYKDVVYTGDAKGSIKNVKELPLGERRKMVNETLKEQHKLEREEIRKEELKTRVARRKERKSIFEKVLNPLVAVPGDRAAAAYAQTLKKETEKKEHLKRAKQRKNARMKKKKLLKTRLIQNETFAKQEGLKEKSIPYLVTRAAAIGFVKNAKFMFANAVSQSLKEKHEKTNKKHIDLANEDVKTKEQGREL